MLAAASHVPVITGELVDVVGKVGAGLPWQTAASGVKVGVIDGSTVMEIVVVTAHCPGSGVKVYVVVPAEAVLTAGDQFPVTVLSDVVGRFGAGSPWQTFAMGVNVGVMLVVTVRLIVVVVAHWPAVGVKVDITVPVEEVFMDAGDQVPVIPSLDVVGRTGEAAF